jgi:hypothetical protein
MRSFGTAPPEFRILLDHISHVFSFIYCTDCVKQHISDGWWLMADDWFVLREEYCWLVAGGWFVLREKHCWLVADKPSEQGRIC